MVDIEENREIVNKCIALNGGYFILGHDNEQELNKPIYVYIIDAYVTPIAKATEEDAYKECEQMNLPKLAHYNYYYKCVID